MDISSIGSGATSSGNTISSGTLDKEAFLQLLVTQLQHQDPLSPVTNEDFLAQLAQFASVEQLESINSGTQTGLMMQQSVSNALSTGLIGEEVIMDGSVLELKGGESRRLSFELDQSATVSVEIRDASGVLVRTINAEDSALLEAGEHGVDWDGLDDNGHVLIDGYYQVSLSALSEQGNNLNVLPRVSGLVEGIRFSGGNAYLIVGGSEYTLSEVLEVRAPDVQES
jgi:flagellar basal-body rod modification protein FlgD